ncbi:unnamed protein product [Soboliphyme baturini]|uniref:Origin recognition complex subunit 1 n=1 Tax=Soboliphyme baturini TaxID=241478 RepID=A0A3P8CVU8_9BILA|nr:unnamed protein product [Soboliphyme baturini]
MFKGLRRLLFSAYTHQQISEILRSRLIGLNGGVDSDAIQLAARKVAAVSGDVRRALEICRLAADISAKESGKKSTPRVILTISHIKEALKTMSENPKLQMIRNASEHEKLLLRSALAEYRRVGVEEFELSTTIRHYRDLCDSDGLNCLNRETLHRCVQNLIESGLFFASPGPQDYTRRLRFNINPEDIEYALKTVNG